MPPTKQPLKYLILYPFSVLTVAKLHNVLLYFICLWIWHFSLPQGGLLLFLLTPIADLLNTGIAFISLWFMLQKFYWRKLELILNCCGFVISIASSINVVFHTDVDATLVFCHSAVSLSWGFCVFWSSFHTSNNVSNLFISEWGRETTAIEIEALEEHF